MLWCTLVSICDTIVDNNQRGLLGAYYQLFFCHTGGNCEEGEECDTILDELENIDDELDETGIIFVTTEDILLAKKYGIKTFPTLVFFRNKDPLVYKGGCIDF